MLRLLMIKYNIFDRCRSKLQFVIRFPLLVVLFAGHRPYCFLFALFPDGEEINKALWSENKTTKKWKAAIRANNKRNFKIYYVKQLNLIRRNKLISGCFLTRVYRLNFVCTIYERWSNILILIILIMLISFCRTVQKIRFLIVQ